MAAKVLTKRKAAPKSAAAAKERTLVIVESPHKAETIEKYLGAGYTVKASMGHLIDLPKSRLGIDVEHGYEPEYITVRGRAKILKALQQDAKRSGTVLLASDNDREGEAIAWHIRRAIEGRTDAQIKRITFNEITPQAIREAAEHPAAIDESKVNAQKARRVLDRLVGYSLSPLLWKKVKGGLSAGRVQSVALRLICEREKEVESFIPEEYWSLEGAFRAAGKGAKNASFTAQLALWNGEKPAIKNEAEVKRIMESLEGAPASVQEIRETEKSLKPRPPFTTSQLQQTAANRLGFASRKTMQIAQQLYEGLPIGSTRVGLITYMRTDSVRIAESALEEVRGWIGKNCPAELPPQALRYATGKNAQDAHEAIRPTYVAYTPDEVKQYLSRDQLRLYSIIWERFVSSQMTNARTLTVSADIIINANNGKDTALFRVSGTKVLEKGFQKVLKLLLSREDGGAFPPIRKGDALEAGPFTPEQHFTQGPPRYTDGSIVKTLEEKGIGRPSTYAPIISVLLDRYYVTRSNKQLVPTVLGRMICDMLVESFPDVIDSGFTADMETKLDAVEENRVSWPTMIGDFYVPFKAHVDEVGQSLESYKGTLDEPTDRVCEKCGRPMVKKLGRYGYFLACTGFPECRNAKSVPLAKCPKCGGDVVARRTKKRGKEFYGCDRYPDCDFLSHFKPLAQNCPKCGWFLVEKGSRKGADDEPAKACINPECDYLHSVGSGE
ncbi:MAG: type I DNA topoisomerase [Treponema sp.]|jgi:DNA topoisomerase-1|nr:type I DNA topoisomerase [Treponema sp.]